jgi:cobalt-zinc-cadmium efflux system outer membrane protein
MRAARELEAARDSLAKRWGEGRATFARVAGQLERIPQVPAKSELEAALEQSPTLARWEKERAMRSAELALAQARRIPDVTVAAGGRYFNDHEDAAFVFEFGVPLPLFDRNRGAIEAARHQSRKVDTERAGARLAAAAALAEAHGELLTAHDQAVALREHVLPDAEKAKRAAHDALQRALFDAHEVLEAERTLFELRVEYVRVLERLHLAAAEVERLTARPLGEFAKAATP